MRDDAPEDDRVIQGAPDGLAVFHLHLVDDETRLRSQIPSVKLAVPKERLTDYNADNQDLLLTEIQLYATELVHHYRTTHGHAETDR